MKNETLFTLKQVITEVKEKGTNKFKLPLILNEMKIDEQIKALEELRKPSPEFEEFQKEQTKLMADHAEIDEQGNVAVYSEPNGKGQRIYDGYGAPNIVKDVDKFNAKIEDLREKHKAILEAENTKQEDFQKTLQDDCDIELKTIDFEDVPDMPYDLLKIFIENQIIKP